ncbi:hypothetical protein O7632_25765 [Solwaraspora sp. WMMD406]|uniref:hypothetical protein n=1 Tax=Solwaraspora sp. WMMD406 TaxID=3016095 RepID=UPI002417190D|nr:hypothetical protein [Solwaraspora sp. WMMD406]MDG4767472.1 hypothetical protein [Solwaraspora sp. WMMD406]
MQRLMTDRHLTREETLRALEKRARVLGVRDFTLSLRQLDRWLGGEVGTAPRPSTCRVVEAEFGYAVDQLLTVEQDLPHRAHLQAGRDIAPGAVDDAARGSAKFALWADSTRLGELSVASLRARLTALTHAYVYSPLTPVFADLVDLRDDLFTLIRNHPDPVRLRETYLLAGTTCAVLAYASGDLGAPQAAMIQTQAALACAERADSPTLTAWVLGNQAMTQEWYGAARQGVRLAGQATVHARRALVPGTVLVRLASIEARAYASLGNAPAVREALDRARAARDLSADQYAGHRDEFDDIGGILQFTSAKQSFYAGSVFLRLGDAAAAHDASLAAIAAYASGPADQRSYGDETLAWVDVAAARVADPLRDLDGAAEALAVVHAQPSTMRIPALVQPLTVLKRELATARYQHARLAHQMRGAIDDLVEQCRRHSANEIST